MVISRGYVSLVQLTNLLVPVSHKSQLQLNVLINKHRRACLADFGLTRILAGFTSSGPGDPQGTVVWMSPEVLWPERRGAKDGKPTKESDVYSLGILIYEVCVIFAVRLQHLRQGKIGHLWIQTVSREVRVGRSERDTAR